VSEKIPLTYVVARGQACTVECVVRLSGEAPARDFLETELEQIREKGKERPEAMARARFLVLFQQMADYGRVSPKRFKAEMDGLSAFRHEVRNKQIRFPCFRDGSRWILTHGFVKPGAKKGMGAWPKREIGRAKDLRGEYFSRKKQAEDEAREKNNDKDTS
jgi:hypothetical protein